MATDPWDKLPDETGAAYDAFWRYLRLGLGRSLAKMGAPKGPREGPEGPRGVSGNLKRWARRFRWVERATAYELYLAHAEARAHADAAKKAGEDRAKRWAERKDRLIEGRWLLFDLALTKANEVVKLQRAADSGVADANGKTVKAPSMRAVQTVIHLATAAAPHAEWALAIAVPAVPAAHGTVSLTPEQRVAVMRAMIEADPKE